MSAARRSTLAALTAFVALAVLDSPTAASQPAPSRAAASPALRTVVAALQVSPQAPELKG